MKPDSKTPNKSCIGKYYKVTLYCDVQNKIGKCVDVSSICLHLEFPGIHNYWYFDLNDVEEINIDWTKPVQYKENYMKETFGKIKAIEKIYGYVLETELGPMFVKEDGSNIYNKVIIENVTFEPLKRGDTFVIGGTKFLVAKFPHSNDLCFVNTDKGKGYAFENYGDSISETAFKDFCNGATDSYETILKTVKRCTK
jgi:hypothetical protein